MMKARFKSHLKNEGLIWSDSRSSRQPKVPCFVQSSLPKCVQPSWQLVLLKDIHSVVQLRFPAQVMHLVLVVTYLGGLSDLRVPLLRIEL